MTISTPASSVTIAGNGATAAFNFSFIAGVAANVVVTYTDANSNATVLVQGAQYTLSINTPSAGQIWGVGGTVTYPLSGAPIAAGTYLTIQRLVPFTQLTSISNQGDFYPQAVEQAMDTLEMQIQQVEFQVGRALLFNIADTGPFATLPISSVRAGKILGFDSSGNPGVFSALPVGAVSSAMAPVVASSTLADGIAALFAASAMLQFISAGSTQAAVALLNYLAPEASAVLRTLESKLNDTVSVLDFGAKGDGATDDTAAFQAAINTGRSVYIPTPSNFYRINEAITCATVGQIIYGDGKGKTVIQIDTAFNTSGLGVFVVTAVLPAPQFRDFQINFIQPDTSNRASLTTYPPAFYAQGMARGVYRGVKVCAATVCMDLRGNTGGTSIIDCELSAFTDHILFDGFLDTVTIQNLRCENDTLTANQSIVYATSGTVGLSFGRGDGVFIVNSIIQCGTQVLMFDSTTGGGDTLATFSNCGFDGGTGFDVSSARLQINNSYFSTRTTSAIVQTGGSITCSGCHLYTGGGALPPGQPLVQISAPTGVETDFNMSGCILENPVGDMVFFNATAAGTGLARVNLVGNTFKNAEGIALSTVVAIQTGANATLQGNRFLGIGTGGSGIGISVAVDAFHNICGNTLLGLTLFLPAGHTQLVSANNN